MAYESVEIDLSDEDQLRLICVTFGISDALLEDIKKCHDAHEQRIVHLVLSEAVTRALRAEIEAVKSGESE